MIYFLIFSNDNHNDRVLSGSVVCFIWSYLYTDHTDKALLAENILQLLKFIQVSDGVQLTENLTENHKPKLSIANS